MTRRSAVVIFPGRGVYGKTELGYLARLHADKSALIETVDARRAASGRTLVADLDAQARYAASRHASSENASAIIYACALADFLSIERGRYDIVAVCGNSLGWYLTLAAGGALSLESGIELVDEMGGLMERHGTGGQIVYPVCDSDWRADPARVEVVDRAIAAGREAGAAYLSIRLGGVAVLAGDEAGLQAMEAALPTADGRYPFRLARHAAFHTPLLRNVSERALERFAADFFAAPQTPMIDGFGRIWSPFSTDPASLRDYTLGAQITRTYDFSKSIEVAIKEFAPDVLILTGPGATLGAPVGQVLAHSRWLGIDGKAAFAARQAHDPFLLAMGRDDQRSLVVT